MNIHLCVCLMGFILGKGENVVFLRWDCPLEVAPILGVVHWRQSFELQGICVLAKISLTVFVTSNRHVNRSVNVYFMFGSFHFRNFVFSYFGHFSCVIFFKFVSVLIFCLDHLDLLSKKSRQT